MRSIYITFGILILIMIGVTFYPKWKKMMEEKNSMKDGMPCTVNGVNGVWKDGYCSSYKSQGI